MKKGKALSMLLALAVVLAVGCSEGGGGGEDGTVELTVNIDEPGDLTAISDLLATAVRNGDNPEDDSPNGVTQVFTGGTSLDIYLFLDHNSDEIPDSTDEISIFYDRTVDGDMTLVKDYPSEFIYVPDL
jgi:hypothetical protein